MAHSESYQTVDTIIILFSLAHSQRGVRLDTSGHHDKGNGLRFLPTLIPLSGWLNTKEKGVCSKKFRHYFNIFSTLFITYNEWRNTKKSDGNNGET